MHELLGILAILFSTTNPHSEQYIVIDRIDDTVAVIETTQGFYDVDTELLPTQSTEGSVLVLTSNEIQKQRILAKGQRRIEHMLQGSQNIPD